MKQTYKTHFVGDSKGEAYDQDQYDTSSYSSILWELEKGLLEDEIEKIRKVSDRIAYLDFATGTGRIIAYMEGLVDTATGIEISEDMVALARAKVDQAEIICQDITLPETPVEGQYDLITTFRFVLNAESALRVVGLKALAARLRNEKSILVFNNHGNFLSPKLIMWPVHRLKRFGKVYVPKGNYMTNREAHEIAAAAGLRIEKTIGYGLLTEKLSCLFSFETALRIDRFLSSIPGLNRLGVNQLYIARLA